MKQLKREIIKFAKKLNITGLSALLTLPVFNQLSDKKEPFSIFFIVKTKPSIASVVINLSGSKDQ